MMNKDISISVCVPALNEEQTLRSVIDDLFSNLTSEVQDLEVIIVDDGSTDLTSKIADEISSEFSNVKVIHHKKNLGIGASFRNALAIAKGDYFFCFPADGEDQASQIIKFLPYLDNSTVVTCHHRDYDRRSLVRRFISRSYTSLLNNIFHRRLNYYNGITIFPTLALKTLSLVSSGFFIFAESLVKTTKKNIVIKEISIPIGKREYGKSKSLTFLSLLQIIKDLTKVVFRNKA